MYSSLKRGRDKRVILDLMEVCGNFYRENDIILNPYDKRSQDWSMFNEIRDEFRLRSLCCVYYSGKQGAFC
ncbi:type IV secretion system DNA-binding domain-containing protein [Enterobacter kobei]|uniref:type IV secretion system DNA-binding domain-containing protein n=1 Tax=Enterobacter kobei TaxID=208224 RepID=UPI00388FF73C